MSSDTTRLTQVPSKESQAVRAMYASWTAARLSGEQRDGEHWGDLTAEPREVELPDDLARALRSKTARLKKWQSLSYTRRREMAEAIESAKKPATRARRLSSTIQSLDDE